jgi:hypothetical protein
MHYGSVIVEDWAMSGLSRRSVFKGATGFAGVAGLAALGRLPGAQLVRAQSAAYEIVSFGPVAEGVIAEGYFRSMPGRIQGIHGNGTAFGNLAASAEKFFPALFNADGSVAKLKSGTYGGVVNGLNADGIAVGATYENIGGVIIDGDEGKRPAAWIDGELVRLDLPSEKRYDFSRTGGTATSISADGTIFGEANGHAVRWVDGAVQVLEAQQGDAYFIGFHAILPDGRIVAARAEQFANDDGLRMSRGVFGVYDNGAFEVLPVGTLDLGIRGAPTFVAVNSAGSVLCRYNPTDFTTTLVTGLEIEPIVLDPRETGHLFTPAGFNAANEIVGSWALRQDLDTEPAIWRDGEYTPLAELLPADHGFLNLSVSGISDDGVISGHGFDADGGFHPLLFVPS